MRFDYKNPHVRIYFETKDDSGTVTRTPSQAGYVYGSSVQLSATPRPNYHFVNWTGDTTATANPLSLIVTRNRTLQGNFALNTYPITVNGAVKVVNDPGLAPALFISTAPPLNLDPLLAQLFKSLECAVYASGTCVLTWSALERFGTRARSDRISKVQCAGWRRLERFRFPGSPTISTPPASSAMPCARMLRKENAW